MQLYIAEDMPWFGVYYLEIEDFSISNFNYCKMVLCYWLVLSTYNVDFLKYFTFFNKLFNNCPYYSYIPLLKNQFSP